jgi:hypothetical protein
MSVKKVTKKISNQKYKLLLDLIGIVVVSAFAYTTALIVVTYQMGA